MPARRCSKYTALTLTFVWAVLPLGSCVHCGNRSTAATSPTIAATAPAGKALRSAGGAFTVVYATTPDPIPLNQPFTLRVRVCQGEQTAIGARDVGLMVDGRMPHHRHGMNTVPRITPRGDGEFDVAGMLFHMSGRWELHFDVTRNQQTERAQDVVMLD